MHINFTGHNIDVTTALKNFTQEKFEKLERHFDQISTIKVVFDVEKLTQIAEASVLVAKNEIHARAESDDMYTAIDELVGKLDRQLIKHKEKIQDHRDHRDHRDMHDDRE
ncbi:ribosome hibernation-promoting factor, HPF/YfiA family [Legionella dresdenensis]|uniref:Ribosome hibernation promoting factor n=1 Tax=Legionella dresdenensis TaxID=450200 RepID=A0ABV8CEV7_9GAMM